MTAKDQNKIKKTPQNSRGFLFLFRQDMFYLDNEGFGEAQIN